MRGYDLSPLFRSTVGFDRMTRLLESALGPEDAPAYPPYNIEKLNENHYRITMAVAGFSRHDLEIMVKEGVLTVKGKGQPQEEASQFLHRGIAARSFERRFQLADHIEVKGADLVHGLLTITLERRIPEALKPRIIEITGNDVKEQLKDGKAA